MLIATLSNATNRIVIDATGLTRRLNYTQLGPCLDKPERNHRFDHVDHPTPN